MYRKDIDEIMRSCSSITMDDYKKQQERLDYVVCALQDYKDGQNAEIIINSLMSYFKNDLH